MGKVKDCLFDEPDDWLIVCGDRVLDRIRCTEVMARMCAMDWDFRPEDCVDSMGVHRSVHLVNVSQVEYLKVIIKEESNGN